MTVLPTLVPLSSRLQPALPRVKWPETEAAFGTRLALRRVAVNAHAIADGSTSRRPSNSLDDNGRILMALCNRGTTFCEILQMLALTPHGATLEQKEN
jgi:hypothetical protein